MTMLITGATGHVGRRVAGLLSGRGTALRLLARDASRAPRLPGARVVAGDYADATSMRRVCDWQVEAWIGSYLALPAGELERRADTVRRLTGRDPIDMETFVLEHPQSSFAHLRPDSAG